MSLNQAGHKGHHAKPSTQMQFTGGEILDRCGNDPSAGSPIRLIEGE
jgi:hypothetical protein